MTYNRHDFGSKNSPQQNREDFTFVLILVLFILFGMAFASIGFGR